MRDKVNIISKWLEYEIGSGGKFEVLTLSFENEI